MVSDEGGKNGRNENVLKNYSEVWKRMCTGRTALDANGIHSPQLFITNTKS